MQKKKKSFREIARICGVSVSTVSRIANGSGSMSGKKADIILSYLKAEGYEIIGDNSQSTRKNICLIVSDLTNEILNRIVSKISELFVKDGYSLSVFVDNNDADTLFKEAMLRNDSGIILIGASKIPLKTQSLIPAIHIMTNHIVNYKNNCYCVNSDDYVGGQLLAKYLLKYNRLHPLILNNHFSSSTASYRIKGFVAEYKSAGIEISLSDIYDADSNKSAYLSAADTINYLWTKGIQYDSIFAASDWRAYGAVSALDNMCINVPNDVTVVGYDGSRISRYCDHPFPSIEQNPELIASTAEQLMVNLIHHKTPEKSMYYIPVQMRVPF